ncbi:hypothetical protein BDZ45DRAFT_692156 [Acephala macrosclerotiorum]|nr:hypothetical protein BDZ45DRAFT_692156 [Acephala macrosclerotiorum]
MGVRDDHGRHNGAVRRPEERAAHSDDDTSSDADEENSDGTSQNSDEPHDHETIFDYPPRYRRLTSEEFRSNSNYGSVMLNSLLSHGTRELFWSGSTEESDKTHEQADQYECINCFTEKNPHIADLAGEEFQGSGLRVPLHSWVPEGPGNAKRRCKPSPPRPSQMKMTLRGYTRPKKESKISPSSRRHGSPRLDRDSIHDGPGRDYASYAAAQAARQDPRPCMRRAPPGLSERGPFPGAPYGVRFEDEQALHERLAFMNLGPGYPHHPYPGHGGGMGQMPSGPMPESPGYAGPPKCITLRSKDFTDREIAAKYVSHLIKHGSETWVFRFSDEENARSKSDSGPVPEELISEAPPQQRHHRMAGMRGGPFGNASKKDDREV